MHTLGIIPARYDSTRFPGKPLADIAGKTMIQRVHERAKEALPEVFVATDDERIARAVEAFGGNVVMTSRNHATGTERCNEAWQIIERESNIPFDGVVNIQGDEPMLQPDQLKEILSGFSMGDAPISTLIRPVSDEGIVEAPDTPKVVTDSRGMAVHFSRMPIPYLTHLQDINRLEAFQYYAHVGMYAYKAGILKEIASLSATRQEQAERLEQLRWLGHGYRIQTVVTAYENISVDTPKDLNTILTFYGK